MWRIYPLPWLLDGVTVALSLQLRYKVILFVRHNPWGHLLLEEILLLSSFYLALWTMQWLTWRDSGMCGPPKRQSARSQTWRSFVALCSGRFDSSLGNGALLALVASMLFPLGAVDFVYRTHFLYESSGLIYSRTGYVSDSSAKIVVRYPVATPIQIEYRRKDERSSNLTELDIWTNGGIMLTTFAEDFVATFELKELQSGTTYQYRTNASHSGSFATPASNPERFTLISTSCIKPGFPYNPFQHPLSIPGLSHLSKYLQYTKADMMLFLGDFIYIDLPRRFGYSVEDYRRAYRQVYASPDWSDALQTLPWVHVYDDHEITNNWSANETSIYEDAIQPFMVYQHNGNPDPLKQGTTYYTFSRGQVSLFMMDTRRYRSPNLMPDSEKKTMLGAGQLAAFEHWLKTAPGWKVVLSSVPFTRNFRAADEEDYWAGYLYERQRLLEMMWETEGVLIITGDRHEHATTAFPPPGTNDTRVIEFSTSPLSQFVNPFAKYYRQLEDSDLAIKYHHEGRSKFGSFTFDTSKPDVWVMEFELVVDGTVVWNYTVKQNRKMSLT